MYTGPLKRIRKRDCIPASITFPFVDTTHLRDVEITLEDGKGKKISDSLNIQGIAGDSLVISLWVKLRNKRGKIVSKRLCALIPTDKLPVYFIDESGPKMKTRLDEWINDYEDDYEDEEP